MKRISCPGGPFSRAFLLLAFLHELHKRKPRRAIDNVVLPLVWEWPNREPIGERLPPSLEKEVFVTVILSVGDFDLKEVSSAFRDWVFPCRTKRVPPCWWKTRRAASLVVPVSSYDALEALWSHACGCINLLGRMVSPKPSAGVAVLGSGCFGVRVIENAEVFVSPPHGASGASLALVRLPPQQRSPPSDVQ